MTPRVRQYAREEAVRFGCSARDILSACRFPVVVVARGAVIRRLRDDGLSVCQIARLIDRHHSTVNHALRKEAA